MKRNIYISYIHSDSMNYHFKIVDKFKGRKYKFSDKSFDPTQSNTEPIEETLTKLAKNIHHSEVTIVLLSRHLSDSTWIPLEVEYSLKIADVLHKPLPHKGILGVVIPDKGNDYSYMMKKGSKGLWRVDQTQLPAIIAHNMFNEKVVQNKHNIHYESFISVYRWEDFVREFDVCVEAAYDKATNFYYEYNVYLG